MSVNVEAGVFPQCIQDVQIINAVQHADVRVGAVSLLQLLPVSAALPIAHEEEFVIASCKCFQHHMAVVVLDKKRIDLSGRRHL